VVGPIPANPMTPRSSRLAARCRGIVLLSALSAFLASGSAQTAPVPSTKPTAEQRAKYDKNKDGVLDADEYAAMQADEERNGTLVLTPFQVSTNKDNGYAAGNTLSGGRADT